MTCEDILKHSKHLSKTAAYDQLTVLGNSLFGKDWDFADRTNSETFLYDHLGQYYVEIGESNLQYGCSDKEYNMAGYVLAVQHMYHEKEHIHQNIDEWNRKDASKIIKDDVRMTNIVRRNLINAFYSCVYGHGYATDPGELDSEVCGLRDSIKYFESDSFVTPTEAKDILFQFMMSEDYGHKEELDRYYVSSMNDMMSAFTDLRNTVVHEPYRITLEKSPLSGHHAPSKFDMAKEFLTSDKYKKYREEFENCEDGLKQDKLLEQTIVKKYPLIGLNVPRLQKELSQCRNSVVGRGLTGRSFFVPTSEIKYAGNRNLTEEELLDPEAFADAVNMLSQNNDFTL